LKDKIKQLAKGKMKYELSGIVFSVEKVVIEVECGKRFQGSFSLHNSQLSEMKGVVYTSDNNMRVVNNSFFGTENKIDFEFTAEHCNAGDVVDGCFTIVSNCGEEELKFNVMVELPYCMTSMGKIRDLFHFANLAKTEPTEAMKLFQSDDFKRVFLRQDLKQAVQYETILYETLMKSSSVGHALEEFLIAVHKKLRINLMVDKTNFEYQVKSESFMDQIILQKDQWGFAEYKISTDVPFIQIDYTSISSENFNGNTYKLEFVMEPAAMRNGINYGSIKIESTHQCIIVQIKATCCKTSEAGESNHKDRKNKKLAIAELIQNYLNFRTDKQDIQQYVNELETSTRILEQENHGSFLHLLNLHRSMITGQELLVKEQLDQFNARSEELKQSSVLEYCIYLYLKALSAKEENAIQDAVTQISEYYEHGYQQWEFLWLLLYLDKKYIENNTLKLNAIREQLKAGCHSPILYFEACAIYNLEPELMHELDGITILIANWGIKAGFILQEAAMQYTYLASKKKSYHHLVYQGLKSLYEMKQSSEILTAICTILIKGNKIENKYFPWYQLGVEGQLRITELYEHYLYAAEEQMDVLLPQTVLLYFIYNSSLSERKKAYLFANIIKNKNQYAQVYPSYIKHIEEFSYQQIKAHHINPNLAVIYEELLNKNMINSQLAMDLPYIMFQYNVECNNPKITGVYVVHKELEPEQYVPLVNGKAQITIFTENAQIFFEDQWGNRYYDTIDYTLNKLVHFEDFVPICYDRNPENHMLVLSIYDKIENYQKVDENVIDIRRKVFDLPQIRDQYRDNCFKQLIQFYYDTLEDNKIEELIGLVEFKGIDYTEQGRIIEYCITNSMYEKAYDYLRYTEYEAVSLKMLIKLCSQKIFLNAEEENQTLVGLAYYIFNAGKYDENILNYLVHYYYGITKELYEIWKTAADFDLDTFIIEERLLAQMLFAENILMNSFSVFQSYYKNTASRMISKAYLNYQAYKYLLNDRVLQEEFFDICKKEAVFEENELTMLALLKHYSEKDELSEEERNFVEFNLYQYLDKGFVLPFFQKLKHQIKIPHGICNKYYAEYKCNPEHKVTIHYRLEQQEGLEEDFTCETMQNIYQGIHVKGFVLFYNETLQYYVTEENEQGEGITESISVQLDKNMDGNSENQYILLNLMLMSKEMQDEKTLLELMKQYTKVDYSIHKLFKPL
jgi:hypothetical protein